MIIEAVCPHCDEEIEIDTSETEVDDIIECEFCGSDLEVVALDKNNTVLRDMNPEEEEEEDEEEDSDED